MSVYLPGSVTVTETKIFKMASGSGHFELFFIHKILIFRVTKIKNGDDLPIQWLNDLVFANFNNHFED